MTKPAASTEARDLRSLLEVVLDAITLPHDAHDYDQRIRERTAWARSAVKGALAEDPADLGWNVDFLRGKLAAEQADADERAKQACRACHRPFTPPTSTPLRPATATPLVPRLPRPLREQHHQRTPHLPPLPAPEGWR